MTPARGDIESALRSERPLDALTTEIRRLLSDGWNRQQLLAMLEEIRESLRAQGRDNDEDVVLEVMDFLAGWAAPERAI
jgi:hypothetical protein